MAERFQSDLNRVLDIKASLTFRLVAIPSVFLLNREQNLVAILTVLLEVLIARGLIALLGWVWLALRY